MQKGKTYNYQDSENSSRQTDMTHIGSDQFWLEEPEKIRGLASFHTDLGEINIQSSFEATPKLKRATGNTTHVRRKHKSGDTLF